jgi:hypothetical protein
MAFTTTANTSATADNTIAVDPGLSKIALMMFANPFITITPVFVFYSIKGPVPGAKDKKK